MSRFKRALGIMILKVGDVQLELKPTMKDVKEFRNILVDKKNKSEMFNNFSEYLFKIIKAQCPEETDRAIIDSKANAVCRSLLESLLLLFCFHRLHPLQK